MKAACTPISFSSVEGNMTDSSDKICVQRPEEEFLQKDVFSCSVLSHKKTHAVGVVNSAFLPSPDTYKYNLIKHSGKKNQQTQQCARIVFAPLLDLDLKRKEKGNFFSSPAQEIQAATLSIFHFQLHH